MSTTSPADRVSSLSISLVTYRSDPQLLRMTLTSLHSACVALEQQMHLPARLTIVDNSDNANSITLLVQECGLQDVTKVIGNPLNVGFGRANNQVIHSAQSTFHLVLNPDVELASDALLNAIQYLHDHRDVVAVSPACRNARSETEFLCKQHPAMLDLLLRGFAPAWIRNRFATRLARYECQPLVNAGAAAAVQLISGCFMLCRTSALQSAGGFNERFFLYFEDFALSRELGKQGALHHVPTVRIIHHGGGASRKGLKHIRYFAASALRFYQQYGWKLI